MRLRESNSNHGALNADKELINKLKDRYPNDELIVDGIDQIQK